MPDEGAFHPQCSLADLAVSFLESERDYILVEVSRLSRRIPLKLEAVAFRLEPARGETEEVMTEPLDKLVESVQRRPSIATRVETYLRQESQQRGTSWLVVAILLVLLFGALVIYGVA